MIEDVNVQYSRIAKLWSAYLSWEVKPSDVANMLILMEVSKMRKNYDADGARNIAGYAMNYEMLLG